MRKIAAREFCINIKDSVYEILEKNANKSGVSEYVECLMDSLPEFKECNEVLEQINSSDFLETPNCIDTLNKFSGQTRKNVLKVLIAISTIVQNGN